MPVIAVLLAVVCLGLTVGHVACAVAPIGPRACAWGHAVMAVGMAAMWLPVADPLPEAVWGTAFVVLGAWFGAAALRAGTLSGELGHLVVGAAAMLCMRFARGAPATGATGGGHAHHGGGSAGVGAGGLLVSAVSLLLAAWFVCEVVLAGRAWTARSTTPARVPAGGHVPAARAAAVTSAALGAAPETAVGPAVDAGCGCAPSIGPARTLAAARPAMCVVMSAQMALMLLLMA